MGGGYGGQWPIDSVSDAPSHDVPMGTAASEQREPEVGGNRSPGDQVREEFAATGLHERWKDAYTWAHASDVVPEFLYLLDTTLTADRPNALGTLLAPLSSPDGLRCLEQWRSEDAAAAILFRLGQAAHFRPEVFRIYPPLPTEVPASNQLRPDTPKLYILATLLERYPPGDGELRSWVTRLRIWLLTHAIDRAFHGNLQDQHLKLVADQLRIACRQPSPGNPLLWFLKCPIDDFDGFNRRLIQRATAMLDRPVTAGAEADRHVLHALIKVARREHGALPSQSNGGRPNASPAMVQRLADTISRSWQGLIDIGEDDDGSVQRIQLEDEDSDVLIVDVDETQSQAQQRLSAHSVLLASAEDLQFLPWSWNRPNPYERQALYTWIQHQATGADPRAALLGALVSIACTTANSLRRVLDIPIGEGVEVDWSLSPTDAELRRLPPHRKPGWQPATTEASAWVSRSAHSVSTALPSQITKVLKTAIDCNPKAQCVGDLWQDMMAETPEQQFRTLMNGSLSRITPGMLAQVLPQLAYESTGDAPLARLLSSSSRSGLPGNCAYGSWTAPEVVAAQQENAAGVARIHDAEEDKIAAGSRLVPLESWLRNAIQGAGQQVEKARVSEDPLAFHNALVRYLVVALFAATGARPIRDPFESRLYFDHPQKFVYINDKASGDTRQGRIVPVVAWLSAVIEKDYPEHLVKLASYLSLTAPELANSIATLGFRRSTAQLPFFFLLERNTQNQLDWVSVSEATLASAGLFNWPLPYNLFRHRLATGLRHHSIDPEIIDGLLGHAELGANSYGDYSTRVWSDDMQVARPAMEKLFNELGFLRPEMSMAIIANAPLEAIVTQDSERMNPRLFGEAARQVARERREQLAREDAESQIDEYLQGRELANLDSEQTTSLMRLMLFYPNGLPRPTGGLRYHYLLGKLEKLWADNALPPKIRKRFHTLVPERSLFNERAPGARKLVDECRQLLDAALTSHLPKDYSRRHAAAVAATLLCLRNQISAHDILKHVLYAENIRLVTVAGRAYLEHGIGLTITDTTTAVRRFRIDAVTAQWLDRALGGVPRGDPENVPIVLHPLHEHLRRADGHPATITTMSDQLEYLAAIMDQANAQAIPGVLTGYLAGRVTSYSLSWADWLRVTTGKRVHVPGYGAEKSVAEAEPEGSMPTGGIVRLMGERDNIHLRRQARDFFADVRKIISDAKGDLPSQVAENRRRDIVRALQQQLTFWQGKVSPAIMMLGQWAASLVLRLKSKTQFNALSSALRYFGTLSSTFEHVAYDANLHEMDEDDITDFYEQLLLADETEDAAYFSGRLREFHQWARTQGIEDPDWSVLPVSGVRIEQVATGFIVEDDYLNALVLLRQDGTAQGLMAAFLLLCAYRFGLRGAEALWLARSDWRQFEQQTVVLIRKNYRKSLKTDNSVRQVPLLFPLKKAETTIIDEVMANSVARFGDADAQLFARDDDWRQTIPVGPLKRQVNRILAQVTGNSGLTLHDARHTVANRVALAVCQPALPREWLAVAKTLSDSEAILLGRTGNTRRRLWAIARLLGHSRPLTTLKSYIHFLGEWSDAMVGIPETPISKGLKSAVNLDQLPTSANVDVRALEATPVRVEAPSMTRLLKFIRLIARGKPVPEAATIYALDIKLAESLHETLALLNQRFLLNPSKRDPNPGNSADPVSFLRRLGDPAWNRLLSSLIEQENSSTTVENKENSPAMLKLNTIRRMIGPNRHLLLHEESDFAWARDLLSALGIHDTQLLCVHSTQVSELLLSRARRFGFEPVSSHQAGKGKRPVYPDTEFDDEGLPVSRQRVAIIFRENSDQSIRSSIEFCLIAVIYAYCRRGNE